MSYFKKALDALFKEAAVCCLRVCGELLKESLDNLFEDTWNELLDALLKRPRCVI